MSKIIFILLIISSNLFADQHSNTPNPLTFQVEIINCKGDPITCNDLKKEPEFEINFENNTLSLSDKDKSDLLSGPSLIKIVKEKTNLKGENIDYLITFFHSEGFMLNFSFKGKVVGNDLTLNKFEIKANSDLVVSTDLKLK